MILHYHSTNQNAIIITIILQNGVAMDINNIGKTIADLRKKNNMSQQELASKLNVSNKTISKWECGNGIPDITVLCNIANLFNLTLDELINYEQQPKTDEIKASFSVLAAKNYGVIKNSSVNANAYAGLGSFGLLVGSNVGQIINCSTSGIVDAAEGSAGGLAYSNFGIIRNCYSSASIKSKGNNSLGTISAGLCAWNSGTANQNGVIENCYFVGAIENAGSQYGLAYNDGTLGIVKDCFVNSNLGDTYAVPSYSYTTCNQSIENCYYSNSMCVPTNPHMFVVKNGTAVDDDSFKNADWIKATLGYNEFSSEIQLWLDDSSVWVFTEDGYPKLYWE